MAIQFKTDPIARAKSAPESEQPLHQTFQKEPLSQAGRQRTSEEHDFVALPEETDISQDAQPTHSTQLYAQEQDYTITPLEHMSLAAISLGLGVATAFIVHHFQHR
jgi:ribosomal protein S12 methylthiotransferase accessory factor YcaO